MPVYCLEHNFRGPFRDCGCGRCGVVLHEGLEGLKGALNFWSIEKRRGTSIDDVHMHGIHTDDND